MSDPPKPDLPTLQRNQYIATALRLHPLLAEHIRAEHPEAALWLERCREDADRDIRRLFEVMFPGPGP